MKKIISLTLSLILTLNLLAIPAFANSARDMSEIEEKAVDLRELGLFKGVSNTDFDLERAPSRTEALVILIRILGKETEALSGTYTHPFTDVAVWADQYIGYAYTTGLTNGVSATEFGTSDATAATFLTFVLRALGYSDTNGADFTWDAPFELAKQVGILTDDVDLANFWRADAVIVAHNALSAYMKDTTTRLAEKLAADGVFTVEQYNTHFYPDSITLPSDTTDTPTAPIEKTVLDAKEIFEKCSPAVFSITTYDIAGEPHALGSGFFIDSDGTALTNAHVFSGMADAAITLADGTVCEIESITKMDGANDYVMLKVKGDGFYALETGSTSELAAGEEIYTIGNPQGLTNSISDGIVSNPKRVEYHNWIQITAPISGGSSGGALINEYGEVIGITTASMVDGQNLNFAIPIESVIDSENALAKIGITEPLSFNDFVVLIALFESYGVSEPFAEIYYEYEPNDTVDDAAWLYNGQSVYGFIDADAAGSSDTVLIPVNAPGKMYVLLYSPMALHFSLDEAARNQLSEEAMSQIDVIFESIDDPTVTVSAEMTGPEDSDIKVKMIDEFIIPKAGIYKIEVSSDTLYANGIDPENPILYDYMLYYVYIPDYSGLTLSEEYLKEIEGAEEDITSSTDIPDNITP